MSDADDDLERTYPEGQPGLLLRLLTEQPERGEGVTEIRTTDVRLSQLREVVRSGDVTPVANDARLCAACEDALWSSAAVRAATDEYMLANPDASERDRWRQALDAYAADRPDASPRALFNAFRRGVVRGLERSESKEGPLEGDDIHHWAYPLGAHADQAADPQNLDRASREPSDVGTGKSAHVQLHQAFGGSDLDSRRGMYSGMAWGDVPDERTRETLKRSFDLTNPTVRIALEEVASALDRWQRRARRDESTEPAP
jgi:hypothetical protein